jgi:hypothetical protein
MADRKARSVIWDDPRAFEKRNGYIRDATRAAGSRFETGSKKRMLFGAIDQSRSSYRIVRLVCIASAF